MEKNITLNQQPATGLIGLINNISKYYSQVLEREIDNRQSLLLIHAQVAFLFAAFPADCPLLLRMLFTAWFATAVKMCRKALRD